MLLRLALAQINPTVGDLAGNAARIVDFSARARAAGADLVLFPEMSLTGYPPEDLLLEPIFLEECEKALHQLLPRLPKDLLVVLGLPEGRPGALFNAAVALHGGRIRVRFHKWFLPNYGVFDEQRYFLPGQEPALLDLGGVRIGLTVCEDVWRPEGPALAASKAGASLILNLSASPFHAGKGKERVAVLTNKARECGAAIAYGNLVGGQDELVYDGSSLVMNAKGRVVAQAPAFDEHLLITDLPLEPVSLQNAKAVKIPRRSEDRAPNTSFLAPPLDPEEEIYSALIVGTRDYVRKNGFGRVLVGLSGGIDSALVAVIAADALGKENVVGVTLPSRFNSDETRNDAEAVARNLGIEFHTLPIEETVQSFRKTLAPLFGDRAPDVAEENLQSRVRGTLLMALSNKLGWLVLTTGNKSELSAGYFTLYGDSAGGFAVIKDLPKTLVYRLARWRNARGGRPLIPETTLTRPPTAELRPNQRDQDSLPPYEVLDTIVHRYVEENQGLERIVKAGVPRQVAAKWIRTIDAMEYKRRQTPPGIKITPRAFGRDRRMPITNKFKATGE
ncbi:MAG: NAD+ synthase [Elusimicrobia bacterium]|nr:NAD+ synthase [Elusimicrobiota bacterium]